MEKKKGSVIAVSAPSGTGKTTIVKQILNDIPDLVFSVSATTRKKRESETHGVEYFFLSEEEFKQKIDNDEFVEWEMFYGNYYGTYKRFIEENISSGKNVILDVDVKGALSLKRIYPEASLIYIVPPSLEELIKRLKTRNTEDEDSLKIRIERAEMELSMKEHFDYFVVNENLSVAIEEAKNLILKIIKK